MTPTDKITAIKGFGPDLKCRGWTDIPGYEGLYVVSADGQVASLPRSTPTGVLGGKVLRPLVGSNGYHRVSLSSCGVAKRYLIHRVVLLAFVGPPTAKQEARHLDGNRERNVLSNLEWGTRSENAYDRSRHGTNPNRKGERHPLTRLTDADALAIHHLAISGVAYREIADTFKTSISTISRLRNRMGWSHIFSGDLS